MSSPLSSFIIAYREFTWSRISIGISGKLFNAPLRPRILLVAGVAGEADAVPSVWSETCFRLAGRGMTRDLVVVEGI